MRVISCVSVAPWLKTLGRSPRAARGVGHFKPRVPSWRERARYLGLLRRDVSWQEVGDHRPAPLHHPPDHLLHFPSQHYHIIRAWRDSVLQATPPRVYPDPFSGGLQEGYLTVSCTERSPSGLVTGSTRDQPVNAEEERQGHLSICVTQRFITGDPEDPVRYT